MDDELENLLHELAGQERERLKRKSIKQVNITTSQNRFCRNADKNAHSFSRLSQCQTFHKLKASQNDYSEQKTKNDAMCQLNTKPMTDFPFTTQSANPLQHNYVSKRGSNYEFATFIRPRNFQLISRYSQDLSICRDKDITYESNFARHLQKSGDNLPLNNTWRKFR